MSGKRADRESGGTDGLSFFPLGLRVMNLVFTIKEGRDGLWCIAQGAATLFSELSLAKAIALARQLGRDEHARTGRSVCVEMTDREFNITVAQYGRATVAPTSVAA